MFIRYDERRIFIITSSKKISDYKCLDDWFVDTYLRHDGETIEQAKRRIIKIQNDAKKRKKIKNNKKITKILPEYYD